MKLYAMILALMLVGCSSAAPDHRPIICTMVDTRTGVTFEDEWEQCRQSTVCKLTADEYSLDRKCRGF